MTISNARRALSMNKLVRKVSRPDANTEVSWKFFNEVYDALAELVDEEMLWEKRYHRLLQWADDAVRDTPGPLWDRLQILKREVKG